MNDLRSNLRADRAYARSTKGRRPPPLTPAGRVVVAARRVVSDAITLGHTIVACGLWSRIAVLSRIGPLRRRRGIRPSRNMVLLASQLPPLMATGGVYRPLSFLKYGPGFGWHLSAIRCAGESTAAGTELLKTIPASIPIIAVPRESRLKPSRRFFPSVDGGFLTALQTAKIAFRTFRGKPPSVVMATGPRFHNFIAAYFIARYFGAHLVLDYRDEWSVETRDFIRIGNRDRKWETVCLKHADSVIFTTRGFRDLYLKSFDHLESAKCHVIHNGWDEQEFAAVDAGTPPRQAADRYVLSFIGRSGSFLSAENFLDTLERLFSRRSDLRSRLTLQFIGNQYGSSRAALDRFQQRFPDVLELVGEVTKSEAIRYMKSSSCLLLLSDEKNKRVRPGKIYEYLAAGPPVLVYGDEGEMAEVVARLNAGFVAARENVEELDRALTELIDNQWGIVDKRAVEEWLSIHTRKFLSRQLFDLLENLEETKIS